MLPSVTAAKKRLVLKALRVVPTIRSAARAAHVHHSTVQAWVSKDPAFARRVEQALASGIGRLEAEAVRRAVDGVERYVIAQGRVVPDPDNPSQFLKVREYSDRLLEQMLRSADPETYSATKPENKTEISLVVKGGLPD